MSRPRTGHNWRVIRAHWLAAVAQAHALGEPLLCPRCGKALTPDMQIDIGHIVDVKRGGQDTIAGTQPECASCNRSAGAKLSYQIPRTTRW